jgi:hypothetical protein
MKFFKTPLCQRQSSRSCDVRFGVDLSSECSNCLKYPDVFDIVSWITVMMKCASSLPVGLGESVGGGAYHSSV